MKTTVLDRLVMGLRVWPENTDYIAGNNGWLWRYQTTGGVSGGPLSPAIQAPSDDPTGRVTKEQWLLAASAKSLASGDRGIGTCFFQDDKGNAVFVGGLRARPAPKLSAAARKYVDEYLEEAYETGLTECPFETDSEDFDAVAYALSGLRFKLDDVTDPNVIAWSGEGLPPIGATIEFTHSNFIKSFQENPRKTVWVKATVKYVSHSNFVYIDDEGIERARTDIELIRYRPLMTAEERYEHRKAKAVKAMMDIYDAPASIGLSNRERMEIIFAAIAEGDIAGVTAIKDDE